MNSSSIGLRVRVLGALGKSNGDTGTITAIEHIEMSGQQVGTPVITMDNGNELRGYECWWEPVKKTGEKHTQ